jgi:hypothetical protein
MDGDINIALDALAFSKFAIGQPVPRNEARHCCGVRAAIPTILTCRAKLTRLSSAAVTRTA